MTDEADSTMKSIASNPIAWFVAVVVAGGGGAGGASFLTNTGDDARMEAIEQRLDPRNPESVTAAVAQIQADIAAMRNARDLQHEQDHFWIACKRGRPECAGLSVDDGSDQ